ncbi:hypothetical protein MMC21_001379 [Puttea exsequens]|nr:hypothetical protein [Puttea exsequens]
MDAADSSARDNKPTKEPNNAHRAYRKYMASPETPNAKEYLPGASDYNTMLTNFDGSNPRNGMSIPAWIRDWNEKWSRITEEKSKKGTPKL